jgi:hypothetical protein
MDHKSMDHGSTDHGESGMRARLRRLDADAGAVTAPFDYDGLMARHATRTRRARRRRQLARATAGALVVAVIAASAWRLGPTQVTPAITDEGAARRAPAPEPRIVRADTYLALAALEDHIARVDDAISAARMYSPQGAEVARLERARNELLDSYARVRYAELVSANF